MRMFILFVVLIIFMAKGISALEPSSSIVNIPSNTSNITQPNQPPAAGGGPSGGGSGATNPINQTNKENSTDKNKCIGENCEIKEQTQQPELKQIPKNFTTYPVTKESNKLLLIALPIFLLVIILTAATFLIISEQKTKRKDASKPL